jgi:acetylornithine/LysW-gamma-L-lysine aminotransferase
MTTATLEQTYFELDVYGKRGMTLVGGSGANLWDDEGRIYIDCMSAQGSANLGHNHPRLRNALETQAAKLWSCPGAFHSPVKQTYLANLAKHLDRDLGHIFLCNSGTESVEAALKFARLATGRTRFVAAKRGFHGRTMGALSTTFQPKYRKPFAPLIEDVSFINYDDMEELQAALDQDVAGLILEPVQGEGGVYPASAGFMQAARDLCQSRGICLIMDEVQTGFGRTGHLFAHDAEGIVPDILCLAKSIAGGLPMGAVAVRSWIADHVQPGHHGSTFGGNPMVCAVANEVLNLLTEDDHALIRKAQRMGDACVANILAADLTLVKEIRHRGLMIGIALNTKVTPILKELAQRGVLALPAGPKVLRLLPPLVITEAQLEEATRSVIEVLRKAAK